MNMLRSALAGLLALLAAATASAQQFPTVPAHTVIGRLGIPGDSGPSQAIPFAAFAAQIGVSGIPSVTIESAGGGCTVGDNTAALLAAVNSVSVLLPVRVLFPNNCTYNFRQANAINFSKAGVFLECTGERASALQYTPSTDGTFLKWSNGVNIVFNGGISKCSLLSADTSHAKVMAEWYDVSTFKADTILCAGGSLGAGLAQLSGGTNGSTCLYSHGRDTTTISKITANAQIPLRIGMNPHAYQSVDQYHFSDLTLIGDIGTGTHPLIQVDPGVVFTNTTFDGFQSWNGGTYGFDYNDTAAVDFVQAVNSAGSGYTAGTSVAVSGGTCATPITVTPLTVNGSGGIVTASVGNPGVCAVVPSNPVTLASGGATLTLSLVAGYQLSFVNVRCEQGVSISGYCMRIAPANQIRETSITNSAMDPNRCGIFLKNTFFTSTSHSTHAGGACPTAVNATLANSNDMLHYTGNYWLTGVTHDLGGPGGLTAVRFDNSPTGTSTTVPPTALYSSTIFSTAAYNFGINNLLVQAGANGSISVSTPAAVGSALNNVWGSVAGTIATSATSPIVANSTTGAHSCPTCVTSSGGGPITGTSPIVVSAAGAVSFVPPGLTGGVLYNNGNTLGNTAPGTDGQVFLGVFGVAPAWGTMSGDATISNTGAVTLASTISAGGPTGSATVAPIITRDAKGRLTAVSSATITPAIGSITGLGTGIGAAAAINVGTAGSLVVNGGALGTPSSGAVATTLLTGALQAAQEPAHTGDVTNTAGSLALTLVAGNAGNLNSGTLLAARMPALTGDCTTSAGAVATTCTKTGGVSFTGAATATYTAGGAWTPADGSGAGLAFTSVNGTYDQIGNRVFVSGVLTYPSTASGATATISGLPVTVPNRDSAAQCNFTRQHANAQLFIQPVKNTTTLVMWSSGGAALTNANLTTLTLWFQCIYPAT